MQVRRRPLPAGVAVSHPIDMGRFLPYRLHLLALKIAAAPTVTLSSGVVVRGRDWRILACLGAFGPLSNADISRVVGMDVTTISRALQYLQQHGLVMSRVSRSDRRKQMTSLTAEGALAHDEIAPLRVGAVTRLERLLEPTDLEHLYRLLDRLDEGLAELDEFDHWGEAETGSGRAG